MLQDNIIVTPEEVSSLSAWPQQQPTGDQQVPQVMPPVPPTRRGAKWLVMAIVTALILGAFGAATYAYVQKIGPFSLSQYTEDTFLTDILTKARDIDRAQYMFEVSLDVQDRDEGALPFTVDPPSEDILDQYEHDVRRIDDVSSILSSLGYGYGDRVRYDSKLKKSITEAGKPYPSTLAQIAEGSYFREFSTTDPVTRRPYEYRATDGGKNFALSVILETNEAARAIRASYGYIATTTIINDKRVTFTKDSRTYLYIPRSFPTPWLVSLSDSMRSIPPDVSGSFSLGALTDFTAEGLPNWSFNLAAIGDMGDLTYKVDIEARKKDENYYVRINNIPSIIPYIGSYKGQWISISPKTTSSTEKDPYSFSFNPLEDLAENMSDAEEEYKQNREEIFSEIRMLAELADNSKLIAFEKSPRKEKVGDRSLYRYDLTFRKEATIQFYKAIIDRADQFKKIRMAKDAGLLTYLESEEFDKTFDYVEENTELTFWTDSEGFPARIENRIRVIPPDTAPQLKDKQIIIVFSIDLSEINEPINIEVPEGARPVEELIDEIDGNTGSALTDARAKAKEASVKANLSSMRTSAEIYYNTSNSYGTQPMVSGAIATCTGGMFKDAQVSKLLSEAEDADNDIDGVICYANGTSWVAGVALSDSKWQCVDSAGSSKTEFGSLPTKLPVGGKCP